LAEPPATAEPQDLLSLVRSSGAPRELRLFAAKGLLPLAGEDRLKALLAVVDDSDSEVETSARDTLAGLPPDDLAAFLDEGDPSPEEIDAISRHCDDHVVVERVIRSRNVSDETLLRLAGTVTGAPQDSLIVNQVRLLRHPALIDALLANPELTIDGRRRLLELREEFFEKEDRRREQERLRLEEEERRVRREAEGIVFEEAEGELPPGMGGGGPGLPAPDAADETNLSATYRRISSLTVKEKVECAQRGTKEERRILIGDANKIVSLAVLKCESVTIAELETFCAMRHLHTEVFQEIAGTREWIRKPAIQVALVNNPAVPLNITLPLVKHLNLRDLRNVTRDRNLPEAVRATAKKLLFEKRG
jgi:hypothetical protein